MNDTPKWITWVYYWLVNDLTCNESLKYVIAHEWSRCNAAASGTHHTVRASSGHDVLFVRDFLQLNHQWRHSQCRQMHGPTSERLAHHLTVALLTAPFISQSAAWRTPTNQAFTRLYLVLGAHINAVRLVKKLRFDSIPLSTEDTAENETLISIGYIMCVK